MPNSYAARTGRPFDVGVIGVAVFEEYRRPPPPVVYGNGPYSRRNAPYEEQDSPAAAPADQAKRSEAPSLGTGHGRREYSYSQTTEFDRASSNPSAVLQLRYDSRENLIAMGVIRGRYPSRNDRPDAFPADGGYVPDPPRRY